MRIHVCMYIYIYIISNIEIFTDHTYIYIYIYTKDSHPSSKRKIGERVHPTLRKVSQTALLEALRKALRTAYQIGEMKERIDERKDIAFVVRLQSAPRRRFAEKEVRPTMRFGPTS